MLKFVPIRIEMWEMFDTKVRVTVPWLRTNSSIWWTFSFECADAPLAKLWCDPAQIWAHLLVATWSSLSVIRTTGRAATRRECSMANSAAPMHNLHRPSDNNGRSRSYRHICITHKTKEENRIDICKCQLVSSSLSFISSQANALSCVFISAATRNSSLNPTIWSLGFLFPNNTGNK